MTGVSAPKVKIDEEGYESSFVASDSSALGVALPWWPLHSASWLWDKGKARFNIHLTQVSHAYKFPHFRCMQGFPVPVTASTGIGRAGLRNRVVYEFICSGEERPPGFWGAITRLLDRSKTYDFIFFPAFIMAGGVRHCNLSALHRAGWLHQQALYQLA
jgi:hypothetical protein